MEPKDPLKEIDLAIRNGDLQGARRQLDGLRPAALSQLPPGKIANLWWRLGLPERGQRVLSRWFTEISAQTLESHPEESAEYAACLLRLGAFAEAEWILSLPQVAATAMAPLYEGFVHLETWDYPRAIPAFLRFVNQTKLGEYWRRVGYVNLASALIYEHRHGEAEPILSRLLHDSQLSKSRFLLGFVLETAAGSRVLRGDFADARKFLDEANRRWTEVGGLDHFFLEKWRVLADVAENPAERERIAPLQKRAIELGHWETVRDCDRYLAIWTHDSELYQKLYFGTPFAAFRERLKKDFGETPLPPRFAFPFPVPGGRECHWLIDEELRAQVDISSQSHALFALLASDFYRAHRLVTLFGWLFPDQHFQPLQVTKRLHEAVRRLNAWLKKQQSPISVVERDSEYSLFCEQPVTLWVPLPHDVTHSWQPLIVRLFRQFGRKPFATRDAQEATGLPRRTLVRQLQGLVVAGHLTQSGNASATRYEVASDWEGEKGQPS